MSIAATRCQRDARTVHEVRLQGPGRDGVQPDLRGPGKGRGLPNGTAILNYAVATDLIARAPARGARLLVARSTTTCYVVGADELAALGDVRPDGVPRSGPRAAPGP